MTLKNTIVIVYAVAMMPLLLCMGCDIDPNRPGGHNRYYEMLQPGGTIEKEYMKLGKYEVGYYEEAAPGSLGKYKVWYPVGSDKVYPLIISNNGTGWGAHKYEEWFRHMASWGFVVVGNEEGTTWTGEPAGKTLEWVTGSDRQKSSPLYGKIDWRHVGSIGHSQGGTGVVNSITKVQGAKKYTTAVLLASTFDGYNSFLKWSCDVSRITVPTLILVADSDGLTSLSDYRKIYRNLRTGVFKAAARRINCGHGDMLVYSDGYVTAWMMWQLYGDKNAAKAFTGKNPELKNNKDYIEVYID